MLKLENAFLESLGTEINSDAYIGKEISRIKQDIAEIAQRCPA